jgi:hypothetical protein
MFRSRKASRKRSAAQLKHRRRKEIAELEHKLEVQGLKTKITRKRVAQVKSWVGAVTVAVPAVISLLQVLLGGR